MFYPKGIGVYLLEGRSQWAAAPACRREAQTQAGQSAHFPGAGHLGEKRRVTINIWLSILYILHTADTYSVMCQETSQHTDMLECSVFVHVC